MGRNDLFLAFYRPVKAICAVQRLQKPLFCLFLPIILASRPMDTGAKSSSIDSVGKLIGICPRLFDRDCFPAATTPAARL